MQAQEVSNTASKNWEAQQISDALKIGTYMITVRAGIKPIRDRLIK